MRISKKYLVPYLWDSCTKLNDGEKLYWLLVSALALMVTIALVIVTKILLFFFVFFLLLPVVWYAHLRNKSFIVSERKVYKPHRWQTYDPMP